MPVLSQVIIDLCGASVDERKVTAPGLAVIVAAIEEARRIFERMNSDAIYRIAETIRPLLFMTASILILVNAILFSAVIGCQ